MFALVMREHAVAGGIRGRHHLCFGAFSTPMRTLPFSAFTALPSVTGHCVEPVFAAVIVMGVVGQNAS